MADTPILNYKGKYDGPEIDKAIELALGLENPESCPYYVHISLSKPDYVLTIGLGDAEGNLFNHAEIDLPLESMVVNATYENGNIILHLQDGTTTEPIPISALIAGLVSETRTIAGIDLKDDITQKELRDALDVYTKDSVDQLISDLEDRIDETLNEMKHSLDGLEERVTTNEEATNTNKSDILTVKNDIAVNNSTIGTRSKNCLEITATSKTAEETGGLTITVNDDKSITINGTASASGYRFTVGIFAPREIKKYLLSGCPSGGGNKKYQLYSENNDFAVYNAGGESGFTPKTKGRQYFTIIIYGNVECNNLIFYPMVRYADITDNTYEPYKPSVNERLVDVEESVSELTPQVEQNKSDISLLEENKLNLNFGYVYSGYGGNTGWKRLAHCEFTPTTTGIIRDITLYIEKMPGTERGWSESSECEGILKFRVLGNKNSNGTYSMGSLFINALLNKELPSDEIALIGKVEGSVLIVEIWCKITALYSGYRATMISNTSRTNGVNPNTQTHWILDSSGTNVSAIESYPAWTYTTTKIIDYYGDIIKGLSDRITAVENK